jgi:AraC-like DNA-binding protein
MNEQFIESKSDWEQRAIDANFSVSCLAKNAGYSVRHLQRQFRHAFGFAPRELMQGLRLERAARQLAEGKFVKEAAAEAGYSRSYFSTKFKNYHGRAAGVSRKRVLWVECPIIKPQCRIIKTKFHGPVA